MIINGFQKLTLLDFPGHTACTLFTGGCNLRCPFCHNALLVTETEDLDTYPEEEILAFLKKRQGILDGVAITGGEPLLQKDIRAFIEKVRDLGYAVKLDTNGTFPGALRELIGAGLIDYAAVDIKNSKEKYGLTVGVPGVRLAPIEETVALLLHGRIPYEFRTTVVREFHTKEDIERIGEWIRGAEKYVLQHFEDSGNLIGKNMHPVSKEEMLEMRDIAKNYVQTAEVRGI
ncbi:MAG: anaerobic ribonucleoside-triphosphate reductase activating protein [Lachnospiraceae bacterium]|nr:anaerobic ribonucleoside-triphosphate reductase activating protein [Lachnospiraceae bacterium]